MPRGMNNNKPNHPNRRALFDIVSLSVVLAFLIRFLSTLIATLSFQLRSDFVMAAVLFTVSDEKRSSGVQLPAKPKLGDQRKKKRKNGPMGKSLFILRWFSLNLPHPNFLCFEKTHDIHHQIITPIRYPSNLSIPNHYRIDKHTTKSPEKRLKKPDLSTIAYPPKSNER